MTDTEKQKNLSVTDAVESDLEDILSIENRCFSFPHTREQLERELSDENCVILCVHRDGMVAGYVTMQTVLDEGYIGNVAVRENFRRNGIADELIHALKRRAEQRGLAFLTLEVRDSNEPAKALYVKNGFNFVGKQKNYYTQPKEDAIIMTLMF